MEDQVANAGIREELILRLAERQDVETLHRFIFELAEAESFPGEVSATPRDRAKALFGERQLAEAVVAVLNGDAVGFALYYPTYSTVLGREGIHLEDLYVSDQYRDGASPVNSPSTRRLLAVQRLRSPLSGICARQPDADQPRGGRPVEDHAEARQPRPKLRLKTWSSLSQLGHIPSEYEGVTHNLNYTTRPNRNSALESNPTAPANMLTYRDRSPLRADDWCGFQLG